MGDTRVAAKVCACGCGLITSGRCRSGVETKYHRGHNNRKHVFPTGVGRMQRGSEVFRRAAKASHLLRTFGLSLDQFESLLKSQHGLCAICLTDDPGARGWAIDHDHTTGVVRGILCGGCNRGLGYLKDCPVVVAAAADYLRRPR